MCTKSISTGDLLLEDLQYDQNFRKKILPDSAYFFFQIFEDHNTELCKDNSENK